MDVIRFSEQRDTPLDASRLVTNPKGQFCYYTDLEFYRRGYHFVSKIALALLVIGVGLSIYVSSLHREAETPTNTHERTVEQKQRDDTDLTKKLMTHEWHKEQAPKVRLRLVESEIRVRAAEATRATESVAAVQAVVPVSVGDQQLIALAIEAGFTAGKIRVKP